MCLSLELRRCGDDDEDDDEDEDDDDDDDDDDDNNGGMHLRIANCELPIILPRRFTSFNMSVAPLPPPVYVNLNIPRPSCDAFSIVRWSNSRFTIRWASLSA